MANIQRIYWTHSDNDGLNYAIYPQILCNNPEVEKFLSQCLTNLKFFDSKINFDLPKFTNGYFNEYIRQLQKIQLRYVYAYIYEIEQINNSANENSDLVRNQKGLIDFQLRLDEISRDISIRLKEFQVKARLINSLTRQNYMYRDVTQYNFNRNDSLELIEHKLVKNNKNIRILCSNDHLNDENASYFEKLLDQLDIERRRNKKLRLVYADFSNSLFDLSKMIILPLHKSSDKKIRFASTSAKSNESPINILLLGETGVGKSTFINALINYLTFDTFESAQSNEPIALVPVSFVLTTGDNFDKHLIQCGNSDDLDNEDFNSVGQSVTRRCRSYVFNLKNMNGNELRIIDTPGFGDTRGIDQDDRNLEHILEYTRSLTHINAICFLLKPNVDRLSICFRTYLARLIDNFGPGSNEKIIFCFTNARSTFYTSGNTAPLIRTVLNSLSTEAIPFKEDNTFYFDNASFRYLIALKNGIKFSDEETQEYRMSWLKSVQDSNRFIKYIFKQSTFSSIKNNMPTAKHIRVNIIYLIRPILETIRNLYRNQILADINLLKKSIKLCPKVIRSPSLFCTKCRPNAFQLSHFWILPDDPHEFRGQCLVCECNPNQHTPIDYILAFDTFDSSLDYDKHNVNNLLRKLISASAEFAYFLIHIERSTKDNLFLIGLSRMIDEEKQICQQYTDNHLNLKLLSYLEDAVFQHEQQMRIITSNEENFNLEFIYDKIETVSQYPIVCEQMNAIRQKQ